MNAFQLWNMLAALLVTGFAVSWFVQAVAARIAFIRLGRPLQPPPARLVRWRRLAADMLGHRTLLKDWRSGMMHLLMFYGFLVLQLGAADLLLRGLSPSWRLPLGAVYPFFTLCQDAAVILVLSAVLYAGFRRYVERLPRLQRGWKPAVVLLFISVLMLSVLWTEAMFIQAYKQGGPAAAELVGDRGAAQNGGSAGPVKEQNSNADTGAGGETNGMLHPAASLAAKLVPLDPARAELLFYAGWWVHLLTLLSFLVYVPQSKHAHLLFAPFNLYWRKLGAPGRLENVRFEPDEPDTVEERRERLPESKAAILPAAGIWSGWFWSGWFWSGSRAETGQASEEELEFGAGRIERLRRDQLLDLYACVECGRCTSVCPASSTGKLLSPMHLIVKLRDHLTDKGAAITSRSPWAPSLQAFRSRWAPTFPAASASSAESGGSPMEQQLVGDIISEQELWACTTCRSCEEQCPVGNEHVDMIVEMRRHLVLAEGRLPVQAQKTLAAIERQGNPWGLPRRERHQWTQELAAEGITVPTVEEQPGFELLFYVGAMGAYDRRSRRIAHAFVRILHAAGVRFAVLGAAEGSSGDTARRLGNDYLYRELAEANIALFHKKGVRSIVTADPHAYNLFRHEYPDLGLSPDIQVYHHTQLIARWLREGRLQPKQERKETVVYHDSCYLGRYNGEYAGPRQILNALPGLTLVEAEQSRTESMCCGAGGGRMWMEEQEGKRINEARTGQLLAAQPAVIATACPYCMTMIVDGLKQCEADAQVQALDIAELVARSL